MYKQHSTVMWRHIQCGFDRALYTPLCVTNLPTFDFLMKELLDLPEVEICFHDNIISRTVNRYYTIFGRKCEEFVGTLSERDDEEFRSMYC